MPGLVQLQHERGHPGEVCEDPDRVVSMPSAVATCVLPRPVEPWKTSSSARPAKSGESISLRSQPSEDRALGQLKPSIAWVWGGAPGTGGGPAWSTRGTPASGSASPSMRRAVRRGGLERPRYRRPEMNGDLVCEKNLALLVGQPRS